MKKIIIQVSAFVIILLICLFIIQYFHGKNSINEKIKKKAELMNLTQIILLKIFL